MTALAPAQLKTIEQRLLWLSHWMIHNANHIRPKVDGIKVRKQTPPIAETLLHVVQAGAVDILATGALPDRIQPGASRRSHP